MFVAVAERPALKVTKGSIIEKTYHCENLPQPLVCPPGQRPYGPAAKEGKSLPLQKGGQEGFGLRRPY